MQSSARRCDLACLTYSQASFEERVRSMELSHTAFVEEHMQQCTHEIAELRAKLAELLYVFPCLPPSLLISLADISGYMSAFSFSITLLSLALSLSCSPRLNLTHYREQLQAQTDRANEFEARALRAEARLRYDSSYVDFFLFFFCDNERPLVHTS